ncbi:MAG: hypothetical protein E6J74_39305, partial [Deltaproteobacteria bacterium]
MDRGLIDSFEINFKSAFRNLKFAILLGALLFALCSSANAQQPTKVPRIGFLFAGAPSAVMGRIKAFRQGLQERGYVEGKNIVIEYRYGEGKLDRMLPLATELVHLKVDVIVTGALRIHAQQNKRLPYF